MIKIVASALVLALPVTVASAENQKPVPPTKTVIGLAVKSTAKPVLAGNARGAAMKSAKSSTQGDHGVAESNRGTEALKVAAQPDNASPAK